VQRAGEHAVRVMSEHDFSQISITHDDRLVGSLNEAQLYAELVRNATSNRSRSKRSCSRPSVRDISTPTICCRR
jgi:predicted transcriptional regulator